jgi:phosphatidylinositol alpha 1,6-mannosyltransferase
MIVAPGPGETTLELDTGRRIPVTRVRSVRLPLYRSLPVGLASERRIRALMTEFRPDIVHLAAPAVLGHSASLAANRLGLRSIAVFQTDLPGFLGAYGLMGTAGPMWGWLRRLHNRSATTLAPTASVAQGLREHGFERVGVWGRGVDHRQFTPSRRSAELRRSWGVGDQDSGAKIVVGYVGRLAPEKNVDRLQVLADDPMIELVIVGDGPARRRLQSQLPTATFTGHLGGAELGRAMASLDVFAHTGDHETFCQTIQEAMASGVAVVAPAAGGPRDLVDHGVDGLLYRAGDRLDLRRQVRRLALDPPGRRRLAEAGKRRVAHRSWEAVGDELLQHYGAIIDRARQAA